jgi:hypothetical protein
MEKGLTILIDRRVSSEEKTGWSMIEEGLDNSKG